ncbi:MAG: hypothetical protein HWN65_14505 [Candidatus Helarchaeota archaeon]|nr:hypothetical protein [Candidatus Helarchaeota archaeon]
MTPDYERKKKEKQLENNESLKEFPDFDLSPAPDREATRHSRPETAGEPYNPVARSYNAPERPPSKTTPPSGATLPSAGLLPSGGTPPSKGNYREMRPDFTPSGFEVIPELIRPVPDQRQQLNQLIIEQKLEFRAEPLTEKISRDLETASYRLREDGDEIEQSAWDLFIETNFPNYEVFWLKFIVPRTNRPTDIYTDPDTDPDERKIMNLHYTVLANFYYIYQSFIIQ